MEKFEKSILWLDDNIDTYKTVIGRIALNRYLIYPVSDAFQCLSIASKFHIDFFILDYKLNHTGDTGLDVLREILLIRPNAKSCFLTNYEEDIGDDIPDDLKHIPILKKAEALRVDQSDGKLNLIKQLDEVKSTQTQANQDIVDSIKGIQEVVEIGQLSWISWTNLKKLEDILVKKAVVLVTAAYSYLPLLLKINFSLINKMITKILLNLGMAILIFISYWIFYKFAPRFIKLYDNSDGFIKDNYAIFQEDDLQSGMKRELEKYDLRSFGDTLYYRMHAYFFALDNSKKWIRLLVIAIIVAASIVLIIMPTVELIVALIKRFL